MSKRRLTAATLIKMLSAVKSHEPILFWPGHVSDQLGWSACQCSARDWQHCHCPVRILGTPLMVESPSAFHE